MMWSYNYSNNELYHHWILGMKWGKRRARIGQANSVAKNKQPSTNKSNGKTVLTSRIVGGVVAGTAAGIIGRKLARKAFYEMDMMPFKALALSEVVSTGATAIGGYLGQLGGKAIGTAIEAKKKFFKSE